MARIHYKKQAQHYSGGYTLIETLMVIVLILILSTISITGFRSFASRSDHTKTAEMVLSTLKGAHAKTLAADEDTEYGVHLSSNEIVLFQGDTYNASASTNEVTTLPVQASITDISLAGGGVDVVFERLSGETNASGTITVTLGADTSQFRIITVHESGLCELTT